MINDQKTFASALERAIAHSGVEVLNGEPRLYSLVADFLGNSPQSKQSMNLLRSSIDCGIPARMYGAVNKDADTQNITVATCRKLLVDNYGCAEEAAGRFMNEFAAALGWEVAVAVLLTQQKQEIAPKSQVASTVTDTACTSNSTCELTLMLIVVVDCSESMKGANIRVLPSVLEELMSELAYVESLNVAVRATILSFSDTCRWMSPLPLPPEELAVGPLTASGGACLGEVCQELDRRMNRQDLFAFPGGSYAPFILLLSDGNITDDYAAGLEALKKNPWYQAASKFAIPIGRDADTTALTAFTGSDKTVLSPKTRCSDLIRLFRMILVGT